MQEDLQRFVPQVHFEQIPIKNLVSNQEYQRNLSLAHVDRTAENFDLYQINPVKISRRNGINYVFNGQHTIEIIARVSDSRETPVWCMVYDDLNYEMEADIFANQMRYTKALVPYEIFVANIEAGSNMHLTIKALVESYSLTLSSKGGKTPGNICAISALEYIYTKYGYHVLDRVLYLCISTWEGDQLSFTANMLRGIAKLIDTYGDGIRSEDFVERLGRVSIKEIARVAKERRNGSLGFAETILMYYNKRTKYSLRWGKLYDTLSENELVETDEEPTPENGADDFDSIGENSDELENQ